MNADTAFATAVTATAAGLLALAVKRAAMGTRPLFRTAVCWLDGGRHTPKREPLGWRCEYCGGTTNDLTEWGYQGYVSPMTHTYERQHGEITREMR